VRSKALRIRTTNFCLDRQPPLNAKLTLLPDMTSFLSAASEDRTNSSVRRKQQRDFLMVNYAGAPFFFKTAVLSTKFVDQPDTLPSRATKEPVDERGPFIQTDQRSVHARCGCFVRLCWCCSVFCCMVCI